MQNAEWRVRLRKIASDTPPNKQIDYVVTRLAVSTR